MLHAVKLQHGDLHSGNVLYDEDSDSVYLADFGLSRSSTCHKVCTGTTGTCIASLVVTQLTPWAGFLAPEVAAALWQGPPADLWAAGVLFASLLEAFVPCLKYYELTVGDLRSADQLVRDLSNAGKASGKGCGLSLRVCHSTRASSAEIRSKGLVRNKPQTTAAMWLRAPLRRTSVMAEGPVRRRVNNPQKVSKSQTQPQHASLV